MSETDVATEAHEDAPVASTALFGQAVLYPDRGAYLATVESLRDEGYCTATDLTIVDYLTHPGRSGLPGGVQPERFEVVVGLFDHARRERVRLRIQVPAADPTAVVAGAPGTTAHTA